MFSLFCLVCFSFLLISLSSFHSPSPLPPTLSHHLSSSFSSSSSPVPVGKWLLGELGFHESVNFPGKALGNYKAMIMNPRLNNSIIESKGSGEREGEGEEGGEWQNANGAVIPL